jgi:WD repeat-containing protein 70
MYTGSTAPDGATSTIVAFDLKAPYAATHGVGMPGPVTAIKWHPLLNQIVVGTGSKAAGACHVLYNPDLSEKGALLCASKQPRTKSPFDFQPPPLIHTPGALPMFRDDSWRKRKRPPEGVRLQTLFNTICEAWPSCLPALFNAVKYPLQC